MDRPAGRTAARFLVGLCQVILAILVAVGVVSIAILLTSKQENATRDLIECCLSLLACGVAFALLSCVLAVFDIADDVRELAQREDRPIRQDEAPEDAARRIARETAEAEIRANARATAAARALQASAVPSAILPTAPMLPAEVEAEDLRRFQSGKR